MSPDKSKNLKLGKRGELLVTAELLKSELEVYLPLVDIGTDLIVRHEKNGDVQFYELQIKSFQAYGRIVGVKRKWINSVTNCYLVVHYRHLGKKPDEYFVLNRDQMLARSPEPRPGKPDLHDIIINKSDREELVGQDLKWLINIIKST